MRGGGASGMWWRDFGGSAAVVFRWGCCGFGLGVDWGCEVEMVVGSAEKVGDEGGVDRAWLDWVVCWRSMGGRQWREWRSGFVIWYGDDEGWPIGLGLGL